MFLRCSKKGLVKTAQMMYNVSNTYYTTLFLNFQEEMALFCKKRGLQMQEKQKGGGIDYGNRISKSGWKRHR